MINLNRVKNCLIFFKQVDFYDFRHVKGFILGYLLGNSIERVVIFFGFFSKPLYLSGPWICEKYVFLSKHPLQQTVKIFFQIFFSGFITARLLKKTKTKRILYRIYY